MAGLSSWVKGFITFTYMPTHYVHRVSSENTVATVKIQKM